jgi:pyruvate formate lyase activating enzyme
VDFKGAGDPKFYREVMGVPSVEPIYDCLRAMKSHNIHIEIINLIVPKLGDSEENLRELAYWIRDNLGEDTPMHLIRFFPSGDMINVEETPIATVEKARKIVDEAGLRYVYTGNIPGHGGENTYGPSWHELLIQRHGLSIRKWNIKSALTCPRCGTKIAIEGGFHDSVRR